MTSRKPTDAELVAAVASGDLSALGDLVHRHQDRVAEAHAALERRVAEHLLAIRPLLTPEQQRKLLGFCAEGVRARCRETCTGAAHGGCAASGGAACAEGGCGACAAAGGTCAGAGGAAEPRP